MSADLLLAGATNVGPIIHSFICFLHKFFINVTMPTICANVASQAFLLAEHRREKRHECSFNGNVEAVNMSTSTRLFAAHILSRAQQSAARTKQIEKRSDKRAANEEISTRDASVFVSANAHSISDHL